MIKKPENTVLETTAAQYKDLIDAQTWEFISRTDDWYPSDTIDFSLQKQREIYDAMCREFHNGYPDNVSATDDTIPDPEYDVPVRRYQREANTKSAAIVYFHGGGFIVGGLESHDDICAELCAHTGMNLTAVDYRLAPEHLHPAGFDDSLTSVVHEYRRHGVPIILCGDSAGANIAAAICHELRDSAALKNVEIAGQVLIYPGLGGDITRGSYIKHANAPMLTTRDVKFYSTIRTGYKDVAKIAALSPLKDNDFSHLPATVAFSAECDPLADDARDYVNAINSAGGSAKWIHEEGLVHGYLRARHSVDRARKSFTRVVDALKNMSAACS